MGELVDLWVFRDLHKYVCTICMKSKARRGEHSAIIDTGMLLWQAYGTDIMGPYVSPGITVNVYTFGIIDYANRRVWGYFIKTRLARIKHFLR